MKVIANAVETGDQKDFSKLKGANGKGIISRVTSIEAKLQ